MEGVVLAPHYYHPEVAADFIRRDIQGNENSVGFVLTILERRPFPVDINEPVRLQGTLLEVFVHHAKSHVWDDRVADFVQFFAECGGNVDLCLNKLNRPPPLEAACRRLSNVVERIVGMKTQYCQPATPYKVPFVCNLVEALLANGATPTTEALQSCVDNNHPQCAKRLLETGFKCGTLKAQVPSHWIYKLRTEIQNTEKCMAIMIGARQWDRSPFLGAMPKDVLFIIIKMIWQMRFDTFTWKHTR